MPSGVTWWQRHVHGFPGLCGFSTQCRMWRSHAHGSAKCRQDVVLDYHSKDYIFTINQHYPYIPIIIMVISLIPLWFVGHTLWGRNWKSSCCLVWQVGTYCCPHDFRRTCHERSGEEPWRHQPPQKWSHCGRSHQACMNLCTKHNHYIINFSKIQYNQDGKKTES